MTPSGIMSLIAGAIMLAASLWYWWIAYEFNKLKNNQKEREDKRNRLYLIQYELDREFYAARQAVLDGEPERAARHSMRYREIHEGYLEESNS